MGLLANLVVLIAPVGAAIVLRGPWRKDRMCLHPRWSHIVLDARRPEVLRLPNVFVGVILLC